MAESYRTSLLSTCPSRFSELGHTERAQRETPLEVLAAVPMLEPLVVKVMKMPLEPPMLELPAAAPMMEPPMLDMFRWPHCQALSS